MNGKIYTVFFSPTGSGKRISSHFADCLSHLLELKTEEIDLTFPAERETKHSFCSEDIVVTAFPVYGGRVPYESEMAFKKLNGEGAKAVVIGVYGNRHYDDAILECSDILKDGGFDVIGAGAFIAEHSLTALVASGRPDKDDMAKVGDFAEKISAKIKSNSFLPFEIKGNRPYKERTISAYVYPVTDENCTGCGICAKKCPMQIIDRQSPKNVGDGCIRCAACIKFCPANAKYFDYDGYSKTKSFLEEKCSERKEPEIFI